MFSPVQSPHLGGNVSNSFADLLGALEANPSLIEQLRSATTQDDRQAIIESAGVPLPSQEDYEEYVSDNDITPDPDSLATVVCVGLGWVGAGEE